MAKTRRTVTYAGKASRGRPMLWGYGYADLARLLGVSQASLRARVARGTFKAHDLETVCREWVRSYPERVAFEDAMADFRRPTRKVPIRAGGPRS